MEHVQFKGLYDTPEISEKDAVDSFASPNIIEALPPPEPAAGKNNARTTAALVLNQDHPLEEYLVSETKPTSQIKQEISAYMQGLFKQNLASNIQQVDLSEEGAGQGVIDMVNHTQQEYDADNPRMLENSLVDSQMPDMDLLTREKIKVDMFYRNKLTELVGEANVADWAAMLTIPKVNINLGNLDSNQSAGDTLRSIINNFHQKSPQEQIAFSDTLVSSILTAANDNELQAGLILEAILNQDQLEVTRILDALDTGAIIAAPVIKAVNGIRSIVKANNMVQKLKTLGNAEVAAAMSEQAAKDITGGVAKALDIDRQTAMTNLMPFDNTGIMPESVSGLSANAKANENLINSVIDVIGKDTTVLKEHVLFNQKEIETAVAKRMENELSRPEISEVKLISADGSKGTFSYKMYDPAKDINSIDIDEFKTIRTEALRKKRALEKQIKSLPEGTSTSVKGKLLNQREVAQKELEAANAKLKTIKELEESDAFQTIEKTIEWTEEDVLGGINPKVNVAEKAFSSAQQKFWNGATDLAESGSRILFSEDKNRHLLNSTFKEILKPMGQRITPGGRKRYDILNELIEYGDTNKHVYSMKELRNPISLPKHGTVELDRAQREAYLNIRTLLDGLWDLEDKALAKTFQLRGFRKVPYAGDNVLGKVFAKPTSVVGVSRENIYFEAGNGGMGKYLNSADDLKDLYERGYRVVRTEQPVKVLSKGATRYVNHILVHADEAKDVGRGLIPYHPGYSPKINKDGFYFTKVKINGTLNGVPNSLIRIVTDRGFTSKSEAMTRKKLLDLDLTKLKAQYGDDISVEVLHDREVPAFGTGAGGGTNFNAMYTGARKEETLLFGNGDGYIPDRVAPLEAIRRNLNDVAKKVPLNEWRVGMMRRWLNSAVKAGALPDPQTHNDFYGAVNSLSGIPQEELRGLKEAHQYILDQLRIPSEGERAVSTWVRGIAETLDKSSPLRGLAKTVNRLDHADPVAAYRAAAFHSLLGFGNMSQLVVQAFGATVAMSINPVSSMKALPIVFATQALDNIKNPKVLAKAYKDIQKAFPELSGIDVKAFHSAWSRSGLPDAVKSIADLDAVSQGLPLSADMMTRVMDAGMLPYKIGEMFNRRMSFATAYVKWVRGHKGEKITDDVIKGMVNRANLYMLNLDRASKANFQKGILSIPTQFWQIHTRMLDMLVGKRLTAGEKFRLATIQTALFGSAGAPFGSQIYHNFRGMTGDTISQLEDNNREAAATWLRGGIPDLMAKYILGADVSVGSRGGIAGEMFNTVADMFADHKSVMDVLSGAGGTTGIRTWDALNTFMSFGLKPVLTGNIQPRFAKLVVQDFLSIASSFDAAYKAKAARSAHKILSRTNILYGPDDPPLNFATILGHAMGFKAEVIEDTFAMKRLTEKSEKNMEQALDGAMKAMVNAYSKSDDPENLDVQQAITQIFADTLHPAQQEDFRERLMDRIIEGKSAYGRSMNKVMKQLTDGVITTEAGSIPSVQRQLNPKKEDEN